MKAELARHAAQEAEPREDQEVLAETVAEVRRDGIEAVVRARAPALVSGPGSQFFHPMIRLAYALGVRHEGQVAAALLDWETRFEVARPVDDGIPRPERNLDSLSSFALAAHIAADEFVTLHMVTGARALRVVSAWLDTPTAQDLITHGAWALGGAYQYVDSPELMGRAELERLRESSPPNRQQIAEAAIESTDAHVIKLADVALTEEQRTGDPLYRFIGDEWWDWPTGYEVRPGTGAGPGGGHRVPGTRSGPPPPQRHREFQPQPSLLDRPSLGSD